MKLNARLPMTGTDYRNNPAFRCLNLMNAFSARPETQIDERRLLGTEHIV